MPPQPSTPSKSSHGRGSPGKGLNRWTYEQRVCLHMLCTHPLKLPWSERTRIFNSLFKDHQAQCGISPPGLHKGKLSGQYGNIRHVGQACWKATWGSVREGTGEEGDRELRRRLEGRIAGLLEVGGVSGDVDDGRVGAGVDDVRVGTGDIVDLVTPLVTPRRSERMRKVTQNPYEQVAADELETPVRSNANASAVANKYATPGLGSRKLPAAASSHVLAECDDSNESNDDDNNDDEYTLSAKRSRRPSPRVEIPPSPETDNIQLHSPKTPKKARYRTAGRKGATMLLHRLTGGPILLTPAEFAEAMLPLVNVTEEAAHPNTSAVLFRYWHPTKSHGINSEKGFVCGRFSSPLVEPRGPPDCDKLEWNDFGHHMNNGGSDNNSNPSPFISTSNLFIWVLRMALKKADDSAYISVIDTSKLDPKAIFHVPPFYEALKAKRVFFKGGFKYRGSHEHLIWDKIPEAAMLKTFSIKDLTTFAASNKTVERVLRLDQLSVAKTSACKIIKLLKQGEVRIGGRVAAAIAELVIYLGLDHTSSKEKLSRAVFEIVQGWALKADGGSQEKAKYFSRVFMTKTVQDMSKEPMSSSDHLKLEHAFLHGIQWSCGELNVHLKGRVAYQVMETRARKRGLTEPGRLIADVLEREKRETMRFETQQQRLQMWPQDRLTIEEGQEEGERKRRKKNK